MQNLNPPRLRDLIHEGAEIEAKLAALEHEVAEAAIERHLSMEKLDRAAWDLAHKKEFDAVAALIKFKAEEKIA